MLTVRRATVEDALDLAPRLREEDKKELLAIGMTVEESLLEGVHSPDPCYVAVDDEGVPQIIFGTHPSDEHFLGFIWMVGTDAVKTHWIQVLRETRPWIERIRGHYTVLANAVHADNEVHIKWLRWAGFAFLRKIEINGHEFLEFAKLIPPEVR
jgi:hypothetical protein